MRMARIFKRKISSDNFDGGLGQWACWAASILVLILGLFKLVTLPLTET